MYGERFVRIWRLYLRGALAAFAYGELDLAQILWTKGPSDEVPMTREYIYPRRRPARDPLAEYDQLANHQPTGNGQPVGARRASQTPKPPLPRSTNPPRKANRPHNAQRPPHNANTPAQLHPPRPAQPPGRTNRRTAFANPSCSLDVVTHRAAP
jgi:hypothetical protein